jgi:hypothetical protein
MLGKKQIQKPARYTQKNSIVKKGKSPIQGENKV